MTLQGIDFRGIAYLVLLALGGFAFYVGYTRGPQWLTGAAKAAGDALNPLSDKNVAYRAANAAFAPAGSSIGSRLAEAFNPDVRAADAQLARTLATGSSWEDQLAEGWEESASDAMRAGSSTDGGAAVGIYPGMR